LKHGQVYQLLLLPLRVLLISLREWRKANSDDIHALAQALSTLASDREREIRMGKAARSIAEQHSWASMAQSYVDPELSK